MAAPTTSTRRILPAARRYARDLWARREFAWHLAIGNLRARNASTTLGLMWWVLNPLMLGGIYLLVFGVILRVSRGVDNYLSYLLSGMFAFYYTRSAMVAGVNSIVANSKLVANLNFPKLVLPFGALVESAVGFLASLFVFYVLVGPVEGTLPGAAIIWLAPAFIIQTVFNFGLSAFVARLAVPFRDVNNIVPYGLRLWLYLSPVIYPVAFLEDKDLPAVLVRVLEFNPLFSILALYRHALTGSPLATKDVVSAVVWAVAVLIIGLVSFVRSEGHMARYL